MHSQASTATRNFADRLEQGTREKRSALLLGLDPHVDLLPEEFAIARQRGAPRRERAEALGAFCCALVDLAADLVPAVKPQSAFFELFGADGVAAWERVVVHARAAGLLVIGDVKRGDVASTAEAYARAHLLGPDGVEDARACDAVTVNPLLGSDSLRPFLDVCAANAKGLYVLVRTSNPGSAEFQRHGQPELAECIARAVDRWGAELVGACGLSAVGAVVGATHPEALRALRAALPRTPLLVPGFGAQGAGARDVAPAFLPGGRGALIASSRAIAFAAREPKHSGRRWRDASREALLEAVTLLRSLATS